MNLKNKLKSLEWTLAAALICVAFAAICSAITDTLLFKFSVSVFKGLDPKWWNPMVSWMYKSGFIVFADSFHFFKSFMLFFGGAAFLFTYSVGVKVGKHTEASWLDYVVLTIILALDWNLVFNLTYKVIG